MSRTITHTSNTIGASSLENVIGNSDKTSYNKLTGYTKIDNRPSTVSAESYALQARGYQRDTTGIYKSIDSEAELRTTGGASVYGVSGVAKVDGGVTATASSVFGLYGQARVDTGGVLAGNSFLCGTYSLIEAGPAVTANHVTSLWLDSHQANAVTGQHDLLFMSNNGAAVMDQAIHVYGQSITSFINFASCTTVSDSSFISTGGATSVTNKIAVMVDGAVRYINLYETP